MTLMVKVILPALVNDSHQGILGGPVVTNEWIDLAHDERRLMVGVVDAQPKAFSCCFHY